MPAAEGRGPHHFTADDLRPDRLREGVEATLADFYQWRDANPELIAEHINRHTEVLQTVAAEYAPGATALRRLFKSRQEAFQRKQLEQEIGFLCVYNTGEVATQTDIDRLHRAIGEHVAIDELAKKHGGKAQSFRDFLDRAQEEVPLLQRTPEIQWLTEQFERLRYILPEKVVQDSGISKALRTTAGVLGIGLYDTRNEPRSVQVAHLRHILPAAYAYGATYPLVDDTLQDSTYVPAADKERIHNLILHGLQTGEPLEAPDIPDHPLADELQYAYNTIRTTFPFDHYPQLYQASEAMYLAQHRDAQLRPENIALHGLTAIYPDIFIKATMSRMVANILGRRSLPDSYYRHINVNFVNQFRDDFQDRVQDRHEGHLTPFTYPREQRDSNPLYDLFAYSAYIIHNVFHNDPYVANMLTRASAGQLATHLISKPEHITEIFDEFEPTDEIQHFIETTQKASRRLVMPLQRGDIRYQRIVDGWFNNRAQTDIHPLTFTSDRLSYIESVIEASVKEHDRSRINTIIAYAMSGNGKRIRPALTLMLAESLDLPYQFVEPLIQAVEFCHTASLVFDDLPAQDNAATRRGKPSVHRAFDEAGAQLAGIGLISSGIGTVAELSRHFPAERVTNVIQYFGLILGPERLCRGQDIDLHLQLEDEATITGEAIIEMYSLKTSTMIEAALVPLMMLSARPDAETDLIKSFAHHAGIVFQIRDDILDATAIASSLGKDVEQDRQKANLVRVYGVTGAEHLMQEHLEAAIQACQALPFNTNLLQSMVVYFASRRK